MAPSSSEFPDPRVQYPVSPFGTERLTGALLDRLTHHVNILEMNGESYGLAQSNTRKSTDTA
jgi:hypothetical protein